MPRKIPQTDQERASLRLAELEHGHVGTHCLRPGCTQLRYCRGLCQWDYKLAKKAVREKLLTWLQLERAGRALPSRRGKEKRVKFFMTAKKLGEGET